MIGAGNYQAKTPYFVANTSINATTNSRGFKRHYKRENLTPEEKLQFKEMLIGFEKGELKKEQIEEGFNKIRTEIKVNNNFQNRSRGKALSAMLGEMEEDHLLYDIKAKLLEPETERHYVVSDLNAAEKLVLDNVIGDMECGCITHDNVQKRFESYKKGFKFLEKNKRNPIEEKLFKSYSTVLGVGGDIKRLKKEIIKAARFI